MKLSVYQKLTRSIQLQTIPISHTFFLTADVCLVTVVPSVYTLCVSVSGEERYVSVYNNIVFPVDRNLYYILNKIIFICITHFLLHALPISAFKVCLVKKFHCLLMQAICKGLFAEPFVV